MRFAARKPRDKPWPMLSTIVVLSPAAADASARAGALMRTLAALVPATVEGVVRDVTLLQVGDAAPLAAIADEAGCSVVQDSDFPAALARGVAGARSPWIFVVKAGVVPSRLFGEEVARALEGGRAVVLREEPASLWARWFPSLAPVAGVVLPRDRIAEAPCASFADVVRRARPARALPTPAFALR